MMLESIKQRLEQIAQEGDANTLFAMKVGLEKESLRVASSGGLSLKPHPQTLGSALTHPWITTDYSEAMCEFITPPMDSAKAALAYLEDLQNFVYTKLEDEVLWATSMPCVLAGDDNIPVAYYGDSNAGRMKHIYRLGLGHRYGRVMQVISGVHFNWSMSCDTFWSAYQTIAGNKQTSREFKDAAYMGLVRNLQRYGWLIPYLFGASPAVCKSFFAGKKTNLQAFDEYTLYEPYATSLRMGDIGYQNSKEDGLGIKANYDSIAGYADSLLHAIDTPAELWQRVGLQDTQGNYKQLNTHILQIENEYYASVRPKQILQGFEKPSLALKQRGIQYVELRSVDVNAYHPLGVDEIQVRFLEAFMLTCLLADSPPIDCRERLEIDCNMEQVARQGRDPGFRLLRNGLQVSLKSWAQEFLEAMWPVVEFLDAIQGNTDHQDALDDQIAKVHEASLTPSARMLDEMRDKAEPFYHFANRLTHMHKRYFLERELSQAKVNELDQLAAASIEKQRQIEASENETFEAFLANYMAQG